MAKEEPPRPSKRHTTKVRVRIADIKPFRLLMWELKEIHRELRIEANPHAERLGQALERFTSNSQKNDDDEQPEPESEEAE